MGRFQFSLRKFLLVVTLIAIASLLLFQSTFWTSFLTVILTCGILVYAAIRSIASKGETRAFWSGFVIFALGIFCPITWLGYFLFDGHDSIHRHIHFVINFHSLSVLILAYVSGCLAKYYYEREETVSKRK